MAYRTRRFTSPDEPARWRDLAGIGLLIVNDGFCVRDRISYYYNRTRYIAPLQADTASCLRLRELIYRHLYPIKLNTHQRIGMDVEAATSPQLDEMARICATVIARVDQAAMVARAMKAVR